MSNVKISVIIPAYNVKDYIEESLHSVLIQDNGFFEIIIVDDGSNDGTSEILENYAHEENIKIISISNSGQGHARNVGMAASSGDYVYFFDSDDILHTEFVRKVTEKLQENDFPDILFFAGKSFFTPGYKTDFFPDYSRGFEVDNVSGEEVLNMFSKHGRISSQPCLYISKRKLWLANNLEFKQSSHEDEEILYPLILAAERVCVQDQVLFYRRVRPMSFMTTPKSKKKAYGCYVIMLSLVNLCLTFKPRLPTTKKIILKRAAMYSSKYTESAKSVNERIDFKTIFFCAIKVRSASLFLRALYGYQKDSASRLTKLFKPTWRVKTE
nr:glycosyltransferase family A protein [uncultured Halomonas sp.]